MSLSGSVNITKVAQEVFQLLIQAIQRAHHHQTKLHGYAESLRLKISTRSDFASAILLAVAPRALIEILK